jgi:hypothetical protein
MKAEQQTPTPTRLEPSPAPRPLLARNKNLTALGAIAAVVLLAVLAGSLFTYLGSRTSTPTSKPTPTVDPTQGYLSMLQTYYVPWARDFIDERTLCGISFASRPTAAQIQQLPTCRPPLAAEIAAGKTLIAQLATAQPPARWQAQHAALRQAMQAMDAFDTQRLQAIDAHSVSQYLSVLNGATSVTTAFCSPIMALNVDLTARNVASLPQPAPICDNL